MSIFYNTGAPTPSTKNTINSVTVDYGIRDFLLNSNLGLNGGFYPQLPMSVNGGPLIGEPVLETSINGNSNVIPDGLPLEVVGLSRYNIAVLPNQFQNDDSASPQLVEINDITTIQGIFGTVDFPQGTQTYPSSPTDEVSEYGLLGKSEFAQFRETATLRNLYVDSTKQIDVGDWISLQPAGFSQQLSGYLDEYGNLNQGGGTALQTSNTLGSIINGQGIGFSNNGVVNNFDLRASLLGRVLGATGDLDDTKLGLIGGQQLALSLANNAAFNVQQEILGGLNLQDNLLSLVKDGQLSGLRPNYSITVPSSGVGRAFDYAASILGFTLPRSELSDAGSIFLSESDSPNIERANSMILNTGKGQIEALISNVYANINGTTDFDSPDYSRFRSGYVPGYKNNKGEKAINPNIYAFGDVEGNVYNFLTNGTSLIPEISYNRSKMIEEYGFKGIASEDTGLKGDGYVGNNINSPTFSWGSNIDNNVNTKPDYTPIIFEKKTLLGKTQKLFNSTGMLNIVSAKGDMNKNSSQIETANGYGFSKGSAVISDDRFTDRGVFDGEKKDAQNTYCRSWTTLDRYDSVQKLIKHRDIWRFTYPYRHQLNNSVLDDNGFVKIAPYKTDTFNDTDVKKYMLSIENLAWSDDIGKLIPCEVGPGDLLSGKKGRIMWFPPYNIQFNENTSANWDKNDFIGRGESLYTYNNSERNGTLSFQIIIDHPSYANAFAGSSGPDDNYVASFFAGCVEPNEYFRDRLTPTEIQKISVENAVTPQIKTAEEQTPPPKFTVYFPNDISSGVYPNYENAQTGATPQDVINRGINPSGEGFGIGSYMGEQTPSTQTVASVYTDNTNYGLNYDLNNTPFKVADTNVYGASDPNLLSLLQEHISSRCTACVVKVSGYASQQGNPTDNKILADNRARTVINTYKQIFTGLGFTQDEIDRRFILGDTKTVTGSGCIPQSGSATDTEACKRDRKAEISFSVANEYLPKEDIAPDPVEQTPQRNVTNSIKNRFYSECSYFEKLTQEHKFVFDSFREKIRYFHPGFHSTTPEGLNSRLTFLQQCVRQGPTLQEQGANNLAFGRPPVCILRVGDFYNTKIIIDNLSIDYEPLVWDLNPEGVGVQPMIANVTLSFKFIGGSSLTGPINKLQNALSFNYYANTQVYDPRADYIAKEKPIVKVKNENGDIGQIEIKDNNTGYYIQNTVNDTYFGSSVDFNERNVNDVGEVEPTFIQTVANNNSSGPKTNQQSPPSGSAEDSKRVIVTSAIYLINNNEIKFNIGRKQGDTTSLSQNYTGKVTFMSDINQKVYEFPREIEFNASDLFSQEYSCLSEQLIIGSTVQNLAELPSDYKIIKIKLTGENNKTFSFKGTLKFE